MRKFTAAAISSTLVTATFAFTALFGTTPAHAKDAGVVGKMIFTAHKHLLGGV